MIALCERDIIHCLCTGVALTHQQRVVAAVAWRYVRSIKYALFYALLCLITELFYPYHSGLIHRHWGNLWLPQCQWSNPEGYGLDYSHESTMIKPKKRNKAKCVFCGTHCKTMFCWLSPTVEADALARSSVGSIADYDPMNNQYGSITGQRKSNPGSYGAQEYVDQVPMGQPRRGREQLLGMIDLCSSRLFNLNCLLYYFNCETRKYFYVRLYYCHRWASFGELMQGVNIACKWMKIFYLLNNVSLKTNISTKTCFF